MTVAAEPRFDPRNERLRDVAPAGRRRRLTQRAHRQEQHHVDGEAEHGAELRLDEREHLRDEDRHDERLLEAAVGALAVAAAERAAMPRATSSARQRARGEAGDVHEPEVGEAVGAEPAVRGAELDPRLKTSSNTPSTDRIAQIANSHETTAAKRGQAANRSAASRTAATARSARPGGRAGRPRGR